MTSAVGRGPLVVVALVLALGVEAVPLRDGVTVLGGHRASIRLPDEAPYVPPGVDQQATSAVAEMIRATADGVLLSTEADATATTSSSAKEEEEDPPHPGNTTAYSTASGLMKGCQGRPDACKNEKEYCELNKCNIWQHVGRDSVGLVVFYANWCPVCNDFETQYNILRNKYDKTDFKEVLVARVNGDENPNLMSDFGIDEYPTILYFHRDCYWSDGGCTAPISFHRYTGATNEADDIVKFVDDMSLARRIEMNVPLSRPVDLGPCPGVAKELAPVGTPCPGMSYPDDGMPPTNKSNLFGPEPPVDLPPSPNLPPSNEGYYPGNQVGWQAKLTLERLDELHAKGEINDLEYGMKKRELGYEADLDPYAGANGPAPAAEDEVEAAARKAFETAAAGLSQVEAPAEETNKGEQPYLEYPPAPEKVEAAPKKSDTLPTLSNKNADGAVSVPNPSLSDKQTNPTLSDKQTNPTQGQATDALAQDTVAAADATVGGAALLQTAGPAQSVGGRPVCKVVVDVADDTVKPL